MFLFLLFKVNIVPTIKVLFVLFKLDAGKIGMNRQTSLCLLGGSSSSDTSRA